MRRPRLNGRICLAVGGGALCALAVTIHVPDAVTGIACLAPALVAFALLGLGHFPGESRLLAFARATRQPRAAHAPTPRRRAAARMPRGGDLLAAALAGRAPPRHAPSQARSSTA
jgi:hypothetical protein